MECTHRGNRERECVLIIASFLNPTLTLCYLLILRQHPLVLWPWLPPAVCLFGLVASRNVDVDVESFDGNKRLLEQSFALTHNGVHVLP